MIKPFDVSEALLGVLKIMISKIPLELGKLGKMEVDREFVRVAMIAELDVISLYEQLVAQTRNVDLRRFFWSCS